MKIAVLYVAPFLLIATAWTIWHLSGRLCDWLER